MVGDGWGWLFLSLFLSLSLSVSLSMSPSLYLSRELSLYISFVVPPYLVRIMHMLVRTQLSLSHARTHYLLVTSFDPNPLPLCNFVGM